MAKAMKANIVLAVAIVVGFVPTIVWAQVYDSVDTDGRVTFAVTMDSIAPDLKEVRLYVDGELKGTMPVPETYIVGEYITFPEIELTDGYRKVTATSVDDLGNESDPSSENVCRVDTCGPETPILKKMD